MNTTPKHKVYPPNTGIKFPVSSLRQHLDRMARPHEMGKSIIYNKGDVVYSPGELFPGICEVITGAVRISTLTEKGEEVTTEILTQTDLFGNLRVASENSAELARALVDSEICIYSAEQLKQLFHSDLRMADWFRGYLIQRWQNLEKRFLRVNTYKSADHVALLYKAFNRKIRDAQGREQALMKSITQKDMADLVGATRQTVSLALKKIGKKDK